VKKMKKNRRIHWKNALDALYLQKVLLEGEKI